MEDSLKGKVREIRKQWLSYNCARAEVIQRYLRLRMHQVDRRIDALSFFRYDFDRVAKSLVQSELDHYGRLRERIMSLIQKFEQSLHTPRSHNLVFVRLRFHAEAIDILA